MPRIPTKSIPIFYHFWIIFFPIASYYFYDYVGLDRLGKAIYFIALPLTILMVSLELIKTYKNQSLYAGYVRGIFILITFSIVMAYLFWEQDLLLGYRVTATYMAVIFFFLLRKINPDIVYLEKIIWILCIIYLLCWGYGILKAPEIVFGIQHEFINNDSRGFFRLLMPGSGILVLSFFLAISKYAETRNKKWIIIFSLLYIAIIMHVVRQVIFFTFLVGLYYLLKKNKFLWLWIILAIAILLSVTQIKFNENSAIGKMIALSEQQIEEHKTEEEDIRITEYKYFFTKYSKNIFTNLFGNGYPHSESTFGLKDEYLGLTKHFFSTDVGYATIYVRYGIIGLILYSLIFYTALKQNVSPKYMYAKLFMIYLVFANIASYMIISETITLCFCLYILDLSYKEQNKKSLLQIISNRILFDSSKLRVL